MPYSATDDLHPNPNADSDPDLTSSPLPQPPLSPLSPSTHPTHSSIPTTPQGGEIAVKRANELSQVTAIKKYGTYTNFRQILEWNLEETGRHSGEMNMIA